MRRFPVLLSIVLGFLLAGLALAAFAVAPSGSVWLGSGIVNPGDSAVYLSYLTQGSEGHVLLRDLYAVEPHVQRFDAIWSSLGVLASFGVPVILVHEGARIAFAVLLVFALWTAARCQTEKETDARLAVVLALGGISTGWIYSVWLGARGLWTPAMNAAPDIATEFALAPILLGGAHAILSVALLLTTIRLSWEGIREAKTKTVLFAGFLAAILLSFHPYFLPLLGTVALLGLGTAPKKRDAFKHTCLYGLFCVLPLIYYLWLIRDPVFGGHHLTANILEPAPLHVWLVTLLPFFAALGWMVRTRQLPKKLDWTHAWILSSVLLVFLLPIPWKRKLTEGLAVPLVFSTLPAWMAVRDWINRQPSKLLSRITLFLLCLFAFLGPIHLVISQLTWLSRPSTAPLFYWPDELIEGTSVIAQTTTSTEPVMLADTLWTNIWLPALTGRRVFVGHNHETPHDDEKREIYRQIMEADIETARDLVRKHGITHLIATTAAGQERFAEIVDPTWTLLFEDGTVHVWKHTNEPYEYPR